MLQVGVRTKRVVKRLELIRHPDGRVEERLVDEDSSDTNGAICNQFTGTGPRVTLTTGGVGAWEERGFGGGPDPPPHSANRAHLPRLTSL